MCTVRWSLVIDIRLGFDAWWHEIEEDKEEKDEKEEKK
jgi:hypothetical protein